MLIDKIKLDEDERVIQIVRKHWFFLFTQIFSLIMMAVFPAIILFALSTLVFTDAITALLREHVAVTAYLYTAWLLIVWMLAFSAWTDYYLDVWTITNKRLIAIDQKGLFNRSVGSFRLERLQDLNIEVNGLVATFLDFGTVEAQTAGGSEEEFRVHGHPKPRELKATILAAADARMQEQRSAIGSSDGV